MTEFVGWGTIGFFAGLVVGVITWLSILWGIQEFKFPEIVLEDEDFIPPEVKIKGEKKVK